MTSAVKQIPERLVTDGRPLMRSPSLDPDQASNNLVRFQSITADRESVYLGNIEVGQIATLVPGDSRWGWHWRCYLPSCPAMGRSDSLEAARESFIRRVGLWVDAAGLIRSVEQAR